MADVQSAHSPVTPAAGAASSDQLGERRHQQDPEPEARGGSQGEGLHAGKSEEAAGRTSRFRGAFAFEALLLQLVWIVALAYAAWWLLN
jgi:hypothetical protein